MSQRIDYIYKSIYDSLSYALLSIVAVLIPVMVLIAQGGSTLYLTFLINAALILREYIIFSIDNKFFTKNRDKEITRSCYFKCLAIILVSTVLILISICAMFNQRENIINFTLEQSKIINFLISCLLLPPILVSVSETCKYAKKYAPPKTSEKGDENCFVDDDVAKR